MSIPAHFEPHARNLRATLPEKRARTKFKTLIWLSEIIPVKNDCAKDAFGTAKAATVLDKIILNK